MINYPKCLPQKSDEELVALALQDQDYYGCLIQRYEQKIMRYVRRICAANRQDAEDILQDVFLSAYRNLNGFDRRFKFSSWIYRIAHNKAISFWRKVSHWPKQVEFVEGYGEQLGFLLDKRTPYEKMARRELSQEVRRVLDYLSPKYRDVLVLRYLEEKDYREISYILRKPMGTVATLISRAKKKFKEEALENKADLRRLL